MISRHHILRQGRDLQVRGRVFQEDHRRGRILHHQGQEREGTHAYTRMELERDVGSAVMEANADKGIRVNLTDPDKTIFIEVRNNQAYIFSEYIRCHAGPPVGSQGRVVADVSDDRSVVSAWLMMKRGCRVIVRGDYGLDLLSPYDPHIRNVPVRDTPAKQGLRNSPRNPSCRTGRREHGRLQRPRVLPHHRHIRLRRAGFHIHHQGCVTNERGPEAGCRPQ